MEFIVIIIFVIIIIIIIIITTIIIIFIIIIINSCAQWLKTVFLLTDLSLRKPFWVLSVFPN